VAMMAQNMELANAAIITAVMNQDGEGMDDLQKFARKQGVQMGLVEPNEEEKAEMEAAAEQQGQQPDPMAMVAGAQAQALGAQAQKDVATAGKVVADTALSKAKATQVLADASKKRAETSEIANRPPEPPGGGGPQGEGGKSAEIEGPKPQRIRRGYELEAPL